MDFPAGEHCRVANFLEPLESRQRSRRRAARSRAGTIYSSILDPKRGIVAGERWERALNEAASAARRCFSRSARRGYPPAGAMNELNLARRPNKRLFGVLTEEGVTVGETAEGRHEQVAGR
jgi:hypothetical protein